MLSVPRRGDLGAGDLAGAGRGGSDVGVRLRGAGGAHWKDPWCWRWDPLDDGMDLPMIT